MQAVNSNPNNYPKPAEHELLFSQFDSGWNREMPVQLITHGDGSMDLHTQTGPDFPARVAKATELLRERDLTVGEVQFIGPTGAYMPVARIY